MNEKRLECFGTANMSDACSQCKDNEACSEETIRRCKTPEMSLEQKAKTFREIAKGIIDEAELDFLEKEYAQEKDEKLTLDAQKLKQQLLEEWVLVSVAEGYLQVAQQEVDRVRTELTGAMKQNESTMYATIERLEGERGLQKQKLETCLSHRPLLPTFTHGGDTSAHIDVVGLVRAYQEWYAELMELLRK